MPMFYGYRKVHFTKYFYRNWGFLFFSRFFVHLALLFLSCNAFPNFESMHSSFRGRPPLPSVKTVSWG